MLTEEEILGRFRLMAETEKIACEEDALRMLARCAFGSMRDGQSIFEQAAVSGNGEVTVALVEEILGLVGVEAAIDLAHAVVSEGAGSALGKFALLQSRGADLKFLYLSLVDVLRDAAVLVFTGQEALLSRHAPSSLERMKALVPLRSREEWMFLLDVAFRSEKDVVATEFPRLGFELLLLRLVNAPSLIAVDSLGEGAPAPAPRPLREAAPPAAPLPAAPAKAAPQPPPATFSSRPSPPAAAPAPGAPKPAAGRPGEFWDQVKRNLEAKKKVVLVGMLASLRGHREESVLRIEGPGAILSMVQDADKLALLQSAADEVAGGKTTLRFEAEGEKKNGDPEGLTPPSKLLERKALEDPGVREFLREFEGSLIEVRPAQPRELPRFRDGAPGGGEAPAEEEENVEDPDE
jgi:DNA polymerase III gamma/tau subunit